MTDHRHPGSQVPERDRPTRAQLRCLRGLAMQAGQSFANPSTKTQASQEITRLRNVARQRGGESRTLAGYSVDERLATAVRDDEISGYGATARWA
jgi:hypothetical protein